ncbi:arsenic metallochaperone ArsD family protein, partial [Staphylococcus epidermidis]|uniref:arsenic metallochaperone ArsD family protein n=1 Tax=Staphylococcus epidermidis TaxID=1282 RepID=UPI0034D95D47
MNELTIILNIQIYQQPISSSTPLSAPQPHQTLINTNQINQYLNQNQIQVQPYNINNNPNQFIQNKQLIP